MRRILRFLIPILGFSGALQALAQTPVPLPVQGNLGSISGSGTPYAGIDIQLQNCPSPASIAGYWGIIQQEYQVMADPSGNINTTVWPNDLITCNGTTGNSQYNLSLILNGVVQGTPQCYQVVSTQRSWNLNGPQQPIACSQTPPNPSSPTFTNLTVTGYLSAANINGGTINSQVNVVALGAKGDCITDDHAAIQAALNVQLTSTPQITVYFPAPPGGCYLTSTLTDDRRIHAGADWLGLRRASFRRRDGRSSDSREALAGYSSHP